MDRRRLPSLVLVASLVSTLALMACGGGGGSSPTGPSSNGTSSGSSGGSSGGTSSGGSGTTATPANTVTATTANAFNPAAITVSIGTTISFVFQAVSHNVIFSGTGAPANIPSSFNTTVTRTFSTAGVFDYVCDLHPGMSGKVTVQ